MKVSEIAFAGYPVTDLKRARGFYEGTLGLQPSRTFGDETTAWIEYDIGPSTLTIGNGAPEWKAAPHGGIVALEVDDFDDAVDSLRADDVPLLHEPIDGPGCRMVVVSDPDGNSILIHKRKE